MNRTSLNRAIGLAMSALQQARAANGNTMSIMFLERAVRHLNKSRASIKRGDDFSSIMFASIANRDIQSAIALR